MQSEDSLVEKINKISGEPFINARTLYLLINLDI